MRIAILGGGESGIGAALLAKQRGDEPFLSERGALPPDARQTLREAGIAFEEEGHTLPRLLEAREIIKSPGIPQTVPLLRALREAGKPVISEIEYAARFTDSTLVAITGSNGKTTTTRLTGLLLEAGGLDVAVAGNIGPSFARALYQGDHACFVLEVSSFQLEDILEFHPRVSLLLNITPDHLDRYGQRMDRYIEAKFRIQENQGPEDVFFYNADDENIRGHLERLAPPRSSAVGLSASAIQGSRIEVYGWSFDLTHTALRGRHNAMNALFACHVARHFGISPDTIQAALEAFTPVPHRLERVAVQDGVEYINDSKATNVDAAYYALESMDRPVVWILGGQDKGNDYRPLLPLVREKVKAMIALGLDNRKIAEAFEGLGIPLLEADSARAAVTKARALAETGDVVLLSPACASFDRFLHFEDRGDRFRAAVLGMNEKNTN